MTESPTGNDGTPPSDQGHGNQGGPPSYQGQGEAQQGYQSQAYPSQGYPVPGGYPGPNEPVRQGTSGMAIVGFVFAFFGVLDIVGLILSIIAFRRARRDGRPRGLALAGIIIASVTLVLSIIGGIVGGVAIGHVVSECQRLGPGTHHVNGVTYTCS